ncbi:O-methyltransferase [Pseudomonas asuensis]|uniref:O-methyltransferase n=1 Tax=Pseudomonas asuensis TaxID=1825787 RepID=A0ABQ2GUZ0_9PSED|nr:O-methyltransferase [Pseudomonas asuensis]GGM12492.1 O-methyltransferase [Pseudomonas asuensis]
MPVDLESLLKELEAFGEVNDSRIHERSGRMLNITRNTGEFLYVMVQAANAKRVLEIGTSNGYSTLWLARAAQMIGGAIRTVELSETKIELARQNFKRSGLDALITQIHSDGGSVLAAQDNNSLDLVFLDSERHEYCGWWSDLKRALRPGGLLIVDNALSHVDEMAVFKALVEHDPDFSTCLVPVGKGEFLATRRS